MSVQQRLYTADDLWEISHGNTGMYYELYEGELIEMAPTGDSHGVMSSWTGRLIGNFVDEHDLGEVVGAETGFILFTDPYTVVAPDVGFISKSRLPPMTGKYYPIAPDMAVEVVSPNDKAADIERKIAKYLEADTRLVWVLYSNDRTIYVCRPGHDIIVAKGEDILDGYNVLPGFRISVNEVFKKLR